MSKSWSELTDAQKTAILVLASIELSLTATAYVDLVRRPAELVRGRKGAWALGILVQPVGPILYLTWGARREGRA
jgi:hypothetical protein